MAFLRKYAKKFSTLWVSNYFDVDSFTLPSDKKVAWYPRVNVPDSTLLAGGISHVAFNSGRSPLSSFNTSAVFIPNPDFIKAVVGGDIGQPLSTFDQAKCNQAVDSYIIARGGIPNIVTTGSSETNPSNEAWAQDYGGHGHTPVPTQYHWIDQRWQQRLDEVGGLYFGDYDGIGTCYQRVNEGSTEDLRAAFQSNLGAWNYMSTHTPFGNPYFTGNAYTYRHGLCNVYWQGSSIPKDRIFAISADLLLSKKALAHQSSTKKICSFAFAGKTELQNRQEVYKRTIGGGDATVGTFPQYSEVMNTLIGIVSMIHSDVLFMWEDSLRYGTDPHVIAKDITDFGSYTGTDPIDPHLHFEYTAENIGYPTTFNVGHNAMLQGVKFYCDAVAWAGSTWGYAPSFIVGTDSSYSTANSEYLLNAFQQNRPTGYLFQQGNKRALICWDLSPTAGSKRVIQWDCNGEQLSIDMVAGHVYVYLGDVSI